MDHGHQTSRRLLSRRLLGGVLAAVAAAATLTGCGSGSSSGGSGASGGPATLNVLEGGHVVAWSPVYLGIEKGWFKAAGINVNLTSTSASTALAAATTGTSVAMSGSVSALAAASHGSGLQIFGVLANQYTSQITVSNKVIQNSGVGPTAPMADRVRTLKGLTIGSTSAGDSGSQLVQYLVKKYENAPLSAVRMTPLQSEQNLAAALQRGSIDGIAASPPQGDQVEATGNGKIYIEPKDVPSLAGMPYSILAASKSTLDSNKDTMTKFAQVVQRGVDYIRSHTADAQGAVRSQFASTTDAIYAKTFAGMKQTLPTSIAPTETQYNRLKSFETELGVKFSLSFSDLMNTSVVPAAGQGAK